MEKLYRTQFFNFSQDVRTEHLTLAQAIHAIHASQAETLLIDLISPEEAGEWWEDPGFTSSPFTKNAHHAGIVATAVTMGQFQREVGEKLVSKASEYFTIAAKINDDLRNTKFVRLFEETMDAKPLTAGSMYPYELLIATRRVYDPYDQPFNFAPHCDDITYGRDAANWPLRKQYVNQLSIYLTTMASDNDAGFVMWDHKPSSRVELDRMHAEYSERGAIDVLDKAAKFVVRPQPGQLTIFRCKNVHAIERCTSQRRTMGMFLVEDADNDWRYFD